MLTLLTRGICIGMAALLSGIASFGEEDRIEVDTSKVLRQAAACRLGINVNYLLDHDKNRSQGARPLAEALKELGVQALRYPGGEKSDANLWSVPPFEKPNPVLARTGPNEWPSGDRKLVAEDGKTWKTVPLDFDAFMGICKAAGAEPVVVVCYDSMYKPAEPGGTSPTHLQLLETAIAWVRYANITKKYGVKYWEIGNESYMKSYNGSATAEDYAKDLIEFSTAMKKVDPEIKIGANGPNHTDDWWKTVLQKSSAHIDFLAIHVYPCWKWMGYDFYREKDPDLASDLKSVEKAIEQFAPPDAAKRLRFCVTEMNSADWFGFPEQKGWKHTSDLGHALVLFDTFGSLLKHPRADMQLLWNTRWMKNETAPELWDALDARNQILPTGRALAVWRQFLKEGLVAASSTPKVRAFASYTPQTKELSIFLINKDTAAHKVAVALKNAPADAKGKRYVFSGKGAADTQPVWQQVGEATFKDAAIALELNPVSLTVLDL